MPHERKEFLYLKGGEFWILRACDLRRCSRGSLQSQTCEEVVNLLEVFLTSSTLSFPLSILFVRTALLNPRN